MTKEITDIDCPDCESPMYRWKDGDHPEHGMTPRVKCNQCNRWIYDTLRFGTKDMEELK